VLWVGTGGDRGLGVGLGGRRPTCWGRCAPAGAVAAHRRDSLQALPCRLRPPEHGCGARLLQLCRHPDAVPTRERRCSRGMRQQLRACGRRFGSLDAAASSRAALRWRGVRAWRAAGGSILRLLEGQQRVQLLLPVGGHRRGANDFGACPLDGHRRCVGGSGIRALRLYAASTSRVSASMLCSGLLSQHGHNSTMGASRWSLPLFAAPVEIFETRQRAGKEHLPFALQSPQFPTQGGAAQTYG